MIGIYRILNIKNNFSYVGKTARSFEIRWGEHKRDLKNNKDSSHLQHAWNFYGEESFKFLIIEECEEKKLKEREEHWIKKLKSWERDKGYNIRIISESVEHLAKETKEKISKSCKGKHLSKETKQKISESRKGKCYGENNSMFGKHHSKETKQKMSESHKGEKTYQAKLTWEQINEIRQKYIPRKYTQKMLAKEYEVTHQTIGYIVNYKTWIK